MSSYPPYSSSQQQPYQPQQPLGSGMAIAALVVGVLALVTFWTFVGGIVLGLVAIVLGVLALRRVRQGRAAGRGMAITGVVLGTLGLLLSLAFIALTVWVFNSSGGSTLTECMSNADGDQAKVRECQDEFQRNLENR
jgi:predicted PurR-regulated permease PerM